MSSRAEQTNQKRSKSPSNSFFKSAPAHIMAPRLMVGLSTLALVILGLVMVYSSSSITAFVEQGDSTGEAIKQVAFVVIGLVFAVGAVLFGNMMFYVALEARIVGHLRSFACDNRLDGNRWLRC